MLMSAEPESRSFTCSHFPYLCDVTYVNLTVVILLTCSVFCWSCSFALFTVLRKRGCSSRRSPVVAALHEVIVYTGSTTAMMLTAQSLPLVTMEAYNLTAALILVLFEVCNICWTNRMSTRPTRAKPRSPIVAIVCFLPCANCAKTLNLTTLTTLTTEFWNATSLSTVLTSQSPVVTSTTTNSSSHLISSSPNPKEVALILGYTLALLVVILGIGSKASHASDVLIRADMCRLRKIYQVMSMGGNACAVGVLLCGRHSMLEVLNVAPWLIARVIATAIDLCLIMQIIIAQKCQPTDGICHNDHNPPRYSPLQQESTSSDSEADWLPEKLKGNKYLNKMREMSKHYVPMNTEVSSSDNEDNTKPKPVTIELHELQPRLATDVITASQEMATSPTNVQHRSYLDTESEISDYSSVIDSELEGEFPHWSGADEEVALDEEEIVRILEEEDNRLRNDSLN